MVRNLSWPAVSHICSLTRFPSSSIVRILKSMPIVVMNDGVNESSLKRNRQHDFPTPESPMSNSLIYIFAESFKQSVPAVLNFLSQLHPSYPFSSSQHLLVGEYSRTSRTIGSGKWKGGYLPENHSSCYSTSWAREDMLPPPRSRFFSPWGLLWKPTGYQFQRVTLDAVGCDGIVGGFCCGQQMVFPE